MSTPLNIGFTGTRDGLTPGQVEALHRHLSRLRVGHGPVVFHHGDCVGADDQAADMAHQLGYWVVAHPPTSRALRAWGYYDETRAPGRYLTRNVRIVEAASALVACPAGAPNTRSGTWWTVRCAQERGVPVTVFAPSGACTHLERQIAEATT